MNLKKFIEDAKLDFSNLYFFMEGGANIYSDFDIKPGDFITFAKADLYDSDTRGLVNALSNAKRAIDCQADSFLSGIGIDPNNIVKQLGSDGLASIASGRTSKEVTLKFRLLETLGIATPPILERMRKLRHNLEHDYKKPSQRSVSDAIGIAELFVQACEGKIKSTLDNFYLGSGVSNSRGWKEVARNLNIDFEPRPRSSFKICFWNHENQNRKSNPEMSVYVGDSDFIPLLKLVFQADWDKDMTQPIKAFLTELGFQLPSKFHVCDADDLR